MAGRNENSDDAIVAIDSEDDSESDEVSSKLHTSLLRRFKNCRVNQPTGRSQTTRARKRRALRIATAQEKNTKKLASDENKC
jgi:hypothetical protein